VVLFLVKAILLFVGWKILYLGFLQPARTLDRPLTHAVGASTKTFLNIFSGPNRYSAADAVDTVRGRGGALYFPDMYIYRNGAKTLIIGDPCNALEVMVLYAGFLLCFPASLKKRLIYAVSGLALIYFLNILRCAALVLISIYYKPYLDVSHHVVFTIVVYSFIFVMWYYYTKPPVSRVRYA
jgi:exosortase family protein XrtF